MKDRLRRRFSLKMFDVSKATFALTFLNSFAETGVLVKEAHFTADSYSYPCYLRVLSDYVLLLGYPSVHFYFKK